MRRRGRGGRKCVSWKRNGAVIIFIPVCSCFSQIAGLLSLDVRVARKLEKGKNSFAARGMKIEPRPRNVEQRRSGGWCSSFHQLMCFAAPSFFPPLPRCCFAVWRKSGGRARRPAETSGSASGPGRSDLLLMSPLERRRRRKITDCWRSGWSCGALLSAVGAGTG